MDWSKKSSRLQGSQRKSSGLFDSRQNKPEAFNWAAVDQLGMLAAFSVAHDKGATMSMSPASGEIGVNVRVYLGDFGDSAIATNAGQLNELFELIIGKFGSTAEDTKMSLRALKIEPAAGMAAD